MKLGLLLLGFVSLSLQAADYQELKCAGEVRDGEGFAAAAELTLTIKHPAAITYRNLGPKKAAALVKLAYPGYRSVRVNTAEIRDSQFLVSAGSTQQKVILQMPLKKLGKKGYFGVLQTVVRRDGTGYLGTYYCRSVLGED